VKKSISSNPTGSRRLILLLALTILSAGSSFADEEWTVRDDGIGPVKIGMTLSQLNTTLGETFAVPPNREDQACFSVSPAKHASVSFLIEQNLFARIDVDEPGTSTSEGVQVGDSEAQALKAYGRRLEITPRHDTEGHYLTVRSADGRYGIKFETEKGKIEAFYAGRAEAIQYVDGCE
jgi:hypothetical protein